MTGEEGKIRERTLLDIPTLPGLTDPQDNDEALIMIQRIAESMLILMKDTNRRRRIAVETMRLIDLTRKALDKDSAAEATQWGIKVGRAAEILLAEFRRLAKSKEFAYISEKSKKDAAQKKEKTCQETIDLVYQELGPNHYIYEYQHQAAKRLKVAVYSMKKYRPTALSPKRSRRT